jgi:hypothetical protein
MSGENHQYMVKEQLKVWILNPHNIYFKFSDLIKSRGIILLLIVRA